ncbi:SLBB domain-containing protein [Methylotenera sp.]|uniref:SLBB domain-containing protein n=1 Tax=Methylotenera sp. TaxID=2051956 RepID=UPI00271B23C6|nr:SLBB domain-containing protein [Methylotenera sp.]MDO9204584.1 SLBB domain-containing protein [Methylotenera sp.]MDP2071286.1 SLBB domain-containing protein [Methylotenera sp.]MDP3005203.1 SLBB domain-containing protein [Methylotenera sp.]MDZ4213138.1 SLBB domain-containing protein [Methylotenera sp.]
MYRMILLMLMFLSCSVSMADTVTKESTKKEVNASRDYILGAGDLVRINVYGAPDMLTEARLSAAGTITFPLIGELKLGGTSPTAAEKRIADLLEKGGFVKKAQVNLVVLQYQSQFVSVLGDVYKPGKYSLDRPSTLSDVLALAGGITPNGSDMVTLIRTTAGKTTKENYDFRDLITKADAGSNPQVSGDDIVYVNAREVSVLGQVNRPGKYSVVSGVRTVIDFLSQAGGVSAGGADKIIVVTKRNGKILKREIDVDLLYRTGDTSGNFELADGDSIYVPRTPVFYIYGEVQRPGSFRLERNMNLSQALSTGGGLSARGTERGMKIKRLVNGVLETLNAKASDLLQADDVVFVGESLY